MSSALLTPATDAPATATATVPLEVRRVAARRRRLAARVRSWVGISAVTAVSLALLLVALFSFLGH